MAYSTVTLTGTYQLPDGTPAKGVVEIIPSERMILDDAGDVILSGRVKAKLDDTGSFSVALPATDDPALTPTGFGYTVAAKLNHTHLAAVSFSLPAATPVVDITDVTQVDPSTFAPDANYVTDLELEARLAGLEPDTSAIEADVTALDTRVTTVEGEVASKVDTTAVDTQVATLAQDPASETSAALAATYATARGANIPRTLAKLRNGDPVTIGVIGDSKMDPGTTGNAAGTAVAKLVTHLGTWSASTITVVNEAQSGNTAASQHLYGAVSAVVAAAPDLTVIELGTNDSNSDANGDYAAGYVKEASWAAIERMTAYLRDAREDAEFVFVGTTPYLPASGSNPKIEDYNTGLRALAATVGAEYVDGYRAFTDYGADWSPLLLDSTHRNDAGNVVLGDALADHFPQTGAPVAAALAPRAKVGKYGIGNVDADAGDLGYYQISAPGGTSTGTYSTSGTWTVDGNFDVTSQAGAYFEVTGASVREFLANIDLGSASVGTAYPVVDFSLDGTVIASDVNLHTQSGKDSTNYWLAPFTGLDGGSHTMRVTLKSGMLRVNAVAVLVGAGGDFEPETILHDFGAGPATQDLSDGATKYVYNTTLNLPAGWNAAEVLFEGRVPYRVAGTTTTIRSASTILRVGGVVQSTDYATQAAVPTAGESFYIAPVPVQGLVTITGNVAVRVESRAVSTDKTNFFSQVGARLFATLKRTA